MGPVNLPTLDNGLMTSSMPYRHSPPTIVMHSTHTISSRPSHSLNTDLELVARRRTDARGPRERMVRKGKGEGGGRGGVGDDAAAE